MSRCSWNWNIRCSFISRSLVRIK